MALLDALQAKLNENATGDLFCQSSDSGSLSLQIQAAAGDPVQVDELVAQLSETFYPVFGEAVAVIFLVQPADPVPVIIAVK